MKPYNHLEIEPKWQSRWAEQQAFVAPLLREGDEKAYILDMFPFPSGYGLHVGHMLGYTGSDILARIARMQGKKVLHAMGWDAFGLPAENFAIKVGSHPMDLNDANTGNYRRQFQSAGMSYDWSRELDSSKPEYYRWTQWLFTLLYRKGLAVRKEGLVNWCPKDQTVLANEQVVGGKCERCGTVVEQRSMRQWYFKITDYADRLIDDLEGLDWPESIKAQQRNWIGRSEGALVTFEVDGAEPIDIFTTRIDTLFGGTFIILAPEHPRVAELITETERVKVEAYLEELKTKTDLERTDLAKERVGAFTGSYAVNPATGEKVQIWIADFVLAHYGTGAVFADAHDQRDFDLAKRYGIPLHPTLKPADGSDDTAIRNLEVCYEGDGILYDSAQFDGMTSAEARIAILDWLEKQGKAKKKVTYKLRDWLVSRQRYWGAPIPVSYDAAGNEHILSDAELPLVLPRLSYSVAGQSPLLTATEWNTYQAASGETLTRETDTLDGFVCSSWYFLRFPNPHDDKAAFDTELVKQWLPVDTYIGGAEHAVLHLLYARFITKVLYDEGLVSFTEPFSKLWNQGMILGPDHQKMSKSKGNVINPDDVIHDLGADSLRTYEMFMAPFGAERPWSTTSIVGTRRFLDKVWRLQERVTDAAASPEELRIVHAAIKKVSEDVAACAFNTCVSTLMETVNALQELPSMSKQGYQDILKLLSPFAPHMTEELWEMTGGEGFCSLAAWPSFDPAHLVQATWQCAIQVNGKVRATIELETNASEEVAKAAALAVPKIQEYLNGNEPKKFIYVPNRLISIVTG